ncbi:hypothetical protein MTP99_012775 [Tenebrio molitor]|jgi:hypothetical protein|nr:hypothetical protein MTP99_012775 [Tenebrio molitor]
MHCKSLPHPSTIQKWYLTVNAGPGFTQEAFDALKNKADRNPIVNLTVDEMAIREHLHWSGKRFCGYVDMGMSSEDANFDNSELAKNALVFMATAINEHWKVPVGYFLINGLNADERANLVNKCLHLLNEVGVKCHSLTFDGAAVNISIRYYGVIKKDCLSW